MAKVIQSRPIRKNPTLAPGVHRFGRSKMYHKRGLFVKKNIRNPKKVEGEKVTFIVKPIGGSSNGGTRKIPLKKSKKYHPTAVSIHSKKRFAKKRSRQVCSPKLRGSLKPGKVLILLAGRHAGKRVVFLKQLPSGLLLISGPFKLNGVPLRRINQMYVIGTSTQLDISNLAIPDELNDSFFRRDKKVMRDERLMQRGNLFAGEKKDYEVSEERKRLQGTVDKQLIDAIKECDDKKVMFKYLATPFSLTSGQYPHQMKF